MVELKTEKLHKKQVWEETELLSMERQNNSSPMLTGRRCFAYLWATGLECQTLPKSLFYASCESAKLATELRGTGQRICKSLSSKQQRISRCWSKGCTRGRSCSGHPSSSHPQNLTEGSCISTHICPPLPQNCAITPDFQNTRGH